MAKENEISDIVKKCKILLLDIEGTTTSISFVKDKLFPYAEENVKEFLDSQWDQDNVKEAVTALRKLALEDLENSVEGAVTIPGEDASKEDQIEGLVKNVKWQMSSDRKVGALKLLQGLIWKQGYDKGDIKGHIYDDVLPALEQWRSEAAQKVYIYSSGSVQAQKLLFGQSTAGDLLPLIDGHFDTAVGAKQEAASYTAIVEKIGCKAEEILFLTDIEKEGEAARSSGLCVGLMSREGNAPLPAEATASYPVLHSFAQLTVSNKRKPDVAQDEQPAKVPKTDTEDDVKTATEGAEKKSTSEAPETILEKVVEEPEKMEVEEEPAVKDNDQAKAKEASETVVETLVEEATATTEVADVPVCKNKPDMIEENIEKTDKKETERMDTDSIEKEETVKEPVAIKNIGEKTLVAEETSTCVITEIEEITDDKQSLSEVAEIIEDLEPVVEEPTTVEDMEDLQNVGEVLEKECDEILSKVQDVTNLDNIPLKPLLNTIAEETMETENIDSNDIVDRILDTEIELGMKPCEDIDLNTVEKIEDEKASVEEAKNEKFESIPEAITEQKPIEPAAEEMKVIEKKVEEISPTEGSKVETKECETEAKVSEVKTDENKMESEESKVDSDERKVAAESKMDAEVSKVDTKERKEEAESKMDAEESKVGSAENKVAEEKLEEISKVIKDNEVEDKSKVEEQSKVEEKSKVEEGTKIEENKVVAETPQTESKESLKEKSVTETEAPEVKESIGTEEVKIDSDVTDSQINGSTTNGDAETANLNGDANKDEELNSRLSVENGKEVVNGSNGNSSEEQGQGDSKVETEVSDIKVKSVAADETRSDPIEQPTEA